MRNALEGRGLFVFSIAGAVLVLVLATAGLDLFGFRMSPSPMPTVAATATAPSTPTSEPPRPSPTATGTPTPSPFPTPALNSTFGFQPVAVMIDNLIDARPQSGISAADVVYEAVTEAWITRFMAIFANHSAPVVGPIRSARRYFIYWANEYNAIYVHAGASPQGYDAADATGISRIDYTYGQGDFWRSADRYAPHNLFASIDRLRGTIKDKGKGTLGPISFKPDAPAPIAEVKEVTIVQPDGYTVEYLYDTASNSYLRLMQRQVHADASNGEQYHPKNVIAQIIRTWPIPGDDAGRVDMALTGSGSAYYFLDGKVIEGSWRKETLVSPTIFLDDHGHRALFNAGQTWIQIVPAGSKVTYN